MKAAVRSRDYSSFDP